MADGTRTATATITPEGAQAEGEHRREAYAGEPPFAAERPNLTMAGLRDAAVATALAAVLFLFFIGIRTRIDTGGLQLSTRWEGFVLTLIVVFLGRLAFTQFIPERRRFALGAGTALVSLAAFALLHTTGQSEKWWFAALAGVAVAGLVRNRVGQSFNRVRTWRAAQAGPDAVPIAARVGTLVGPIMFIFGLSFPILAVLLSAYTETFAGQDRQYIDLGILVMTYIMLGWGLNIVVGLAGLLDLGYVAFYAVGAYSYALLAQYFDLGFWICMPLAGILAAFWGLILGFPVLRLRGDYLAIVTLAFGEIIRVVLLNWYEFTGGPDGISRIPRPSFFGLEFSRGKDGFASFFGIEYDSIHRFIYFYFIIFALALLTNFVVNRLRRLPVGRAWEALREDEIACRSLGLNTTNVKLTAFATGAMFGGIAGSFFATRQGFISPESFTFIESAIILAIVVLGGLGSQIGVVFAAIAMIGGFELFRELEGYRMLIFGLAMVLIMVWRPRGLIATREPSIALKEKKAIGGDLVAQGEGHG